MHQNMALQIFIKCRVCTSTVSLTPVIPEFWIFSSKLAEGSYLMINHIKMTMRVRHFSHLEFPIFLNTTQSFCTVMVWGLLCSLPVILLAFPNCFQHISLIITKLFILFKPGEFHWGHIFTYIIYTALCCFYKKCPHFIAWLIFYRKD